MIDGRYRALLIGKVRSALVPKQAISNLSGSDAQPSHQLDYATSQ